MRFGGEDAMLSPFFVRVRNGFELLLDLLLVRR
jgi:hypothetical protein